MFEGYMDVDVRRGSHGHTRYDLGGQYMNIHCSGEIGRIVNGQFFGMITSRRSETPFKDAEMAAKPKPTEPEKPKLKLYDPETKEFYEQSSSTTTTETT